MENPIAWDESGRGQARTGRGPGEAGRGPGEAGRGRDSCVSEGYESVRQAKWNTGIACAYQGRRLINTSFFGRRPLSEGASVLCSEAKQRQYFVWMPDWEGRWLGWPDRVLRAKDLCSFSAPSCRSACWKPPACRGLRVGLSKDQRCPQAASAMASGSYR